MEEEQIRKSKSKTGLWILGGIVGFLLLGILVVLTAFRIDTIQVTGSSHYTKEEIISFVKGDGYINNTLLLLLKNKLDPIEGLAFVEKVDIEYESPHAISIIVYEKAMAGCTEYMDQYVYFDKDGIVLDISQTKLESVPCVQGLQFEHMMIHEKLPIEDEERFKLILNMTQLLQKYELSITGIRFDTNGRIFLYDGDIKIQLGNKEGVEDKIIELGNILHSLEGRKGTLYMEDYTREKGNATFKEEK